MNANQFYEITPELEHMAEMSRQAATIQPELFTKYDVKRGLRDLNGKGVLVGLTEISDVRATKVVMGSLSPRMGSFTIGGTMSKA